MLLLGIDVGTSSIKVSVVDAETQQCVAAAQYPGEEVPLIVPQPGWAEQSAETWWEHVKQGILNCNISGNYAPTDIAAVGIAYQMHGLVIVDDNQTPLRNSIIWCDSRAVVIGDNAFSSIGKEKCLSRLLNSPGNFTASKLAWVKEHEPSVYARIYKAMLPGDFISMRFTGEITTTPSALSEGILWDFREEGLSIDVMDHFGFDKKLIPSVLPVFGSHGFLKNTIAEQLGLKAGIPVSYKAGDQLNNALSVSVLQPGQIAATAGTSGVLFGVSDKLTYDPESRINSFVHVNHREGVNRVGTLLCINGAGIFNRWVKNLLGSNLSYEALNVLAANTAPGSSGLMSLPFGNGVERMLNNRLIGAHFHNLDLNTHTQAHMVRAVQEGISFAFRYGIDIMRENGIHPQVIRAGKSNLFLSNVFTESFVNTTNVPVEFYEGDGSFGAAIGAGIGIGIFDRDDPYIKRATLNTVEPQQVDLYDNLYGEWKDLLVERMEHSNKYEKST